MTISMKLAQEVIDYIEELRQRVKTESDSTWRLGYALGRMDAMDGRPYNSTPWRLLDPAPSPSPEAEEWLNAKGDLDWRRFWVAVREMGLDRFDVHELLGVESTYDYLREHGVTLPQVVDVLRYKGKRAGKC